MQSKNKSDKELKAIAEKLIEMVDDLSDEDLQTIAEMLVGAMLAKDSDDKCRMYV